MFFQVVMCVLVKLLHVFKLLGICEWTGIYICEYSHTQIAVHICKSYFSFLDHVIHICDHFDSNFSPFMV